MLRTSVKSALRFAPCRRLATMHEPGVVGLTQDDDARKTLSDLFNATLDAVKSIPESAAYRINVEKVVKYRLDVVTSTEDLAKIEATLDLGQIPEIIEQAQDELNLIPYMLEWKPWEIGDKKPPLIKVVE